MKRHSRFTLWLCSWILKGTHIGERLAGSCISWEQVQHQRVEVKRKQTVVKGKAGFPATGTVWVLNRLQGWAGGSGLGLHTLGRRHTQDAGCPVWGRRGEGLPDRAEPCPGTSSIFSSSRSLTLKTANTLVAKSPSSFLLVGPSLWWALLSTSAPNAYTD